MEEYIQRFENFLDVGNPKHVVAFDDVLSQCKEKDRIRKLLDFVLLILEQHDYASLELENTRLITDLITLTRYVQKKSIICPINQERNSQSSNSNFAPGSCSIDMQQAEIMKKYSSKKSLKNMHAKSFCPLSQISIDEKLKSLRQLQKQVEISKDNNFLKNSFNEVYSMMKLQIEMNKNLIEEEKIYKSKINELESNQVDKIYQKKLENTIKKVSSKYQQTKQKYIEIYENNKVLILNNAKIQDKMNDVKQKIEELKEKQGKNVCLLNKHQEDKEHVIKRYSDLERKCIKQKQRINELKNQIEFFKIQKVKDENEIRTLRQKEVENEEEKERTNNRNSQTVQLLRNTLFEKSQEIAKKENEIEELKKELNESVTNKKIESLRYKIQCLQTTLLSIDPSRFYKEIESLKMLVKEKDNLILYLHNKNGIKTPPSNNQSNVSSCFDDFEEELKLFENLIENSQYKTQNRGTKLISE